MTKDLASLPRCGEITGRKNKRGELCRSPLLGGKCPNHDADTRLRNQRAAATQKRQDPDGYKRQRVLAGERGAAETLRKYGALMLLKNLVAKHQPTKPEKWFIRLLKVHSLNGYTFQQIVESETAGYYYVLDFYWPDRNVLVEVDGWRKQPNAFGLKDFRAMDRLDEKVTYMKSLGTRVLVLHYQASKAARLVLETEALTFLKENLNGKPDDES